MATTRKTPQRLYLMQLHSTLVPTPDRQLAMVLGCYLIRTTDGKNILIDSGLPPEHEQPETAPAVGARTVTTCLHDLDLRPDDIDAVICTHFDVDHAGHHDAFTRAELVVQREHYERARSGDPRYAATRPHWDHPALHYRLIDGDTELLPGLVLLKTSGHARGHQSILVRLPRTGPVLLAIDAVPLQRLFVPDRQPWPMDEDHEQMRSSTKKLLGVVRREQVRLVVFGHDGEQWETLKRAPAYYD